VPDGHPAAVVNFGGAPNPNFNPQYAAAFDRAIMTAGAQGITLSIGQAEQQAAAALSAHQTAAALTRQEAANRQQQQQVVGYVGRGGAMARVSVGLNARYTALQTRAVRGPAAQNRERQPRMLTAAQVRARNQVHAAEARLRATTRLFNPDRVQVLYSQISRLRDAIHMAERRGVAPAFLQPFRAQLEEVAVAGWNYNARMQEYLETAGWGRAGFILDQIENLVGSGQISGREAEARLAEVNRMIAQQLSPAQAEQLVMELTGQMADAAMRAYEASLTVNGLR
jgi:hypothetical protein